MKFYCAWYCPFAQRVWMTLVHKKINHEYIEVDPYRETDWWMKISRGEGLVPVLVAANSDGVGETTIIESNRILEYLDHYQPHINPIFSSDPNQRAEQKYWMDFFSNRVTPQFYQLLKSSNPDQQHDLEENLVEGLFILASNMSGDGVYFNGETLGAVDISLFPVAYRINLLLNHYRDFSLPRKGESWQRYRDWFEAMLKHPTFRKTACDQGDYERRLIEHYLPYTEGKE